MKYPFYYSYKNPFNIGNYNKRKYSALRTDSVRKGKKLKNTISTCFIKSKKETENISFSNRPRNISNKSNKNPISPKKKTEIIKRNKTIGTFVSNLQMNEKKKEIQIQHYNSISKVINNQIEIEDKEDIHDYRNVYYQTRVYNKIYLFIKIIKTHFSLTK